MIDLGAHFDGFKGLLTADAQLTVEEVARVNTAGTPIRAAYVVVSGNEPEEWADDRFTIPPSSDATATFAYNVRSVAPDADGVRLLRARVFGLLIGKKFAVTGRAIDAIAFDNGSRVIPDDAVKPPLFYADDEFLFTSRRATS